MNLKIKHRAHHEWLAAGPEDPPLDGEEVRMIHPHQPTAVLVRRLVEKDDGVTTLMIPDESVERMTKDFALHKHGVAKPKRVHMHDILTQHIAHAMTKHSPTEHWTDIEVDGDKQLEDHLKTVFLSEVGESA